MKAVGWMLAASALALAGCQKVGTELSCGGDTFKVDFGDKKATATAADKSTVELPLLEQPGAAGPAKVYTDGAMTFTRTEAPGQPPVIRFARGKMAFQDCRMAAS